MQVRRLNMPLFSLPPDHIAHRFLEAFIACRQNCVGREIAYEGSGVQPIDQEWTSTSDGRVRQLSAFAYEHLSFDLILDGWLSGAPELTVTECASLERLPYLTMLMTECHDACRKSNNATALALVEQILELLQLWESCIRARIQ